VVVSVIVLLWGLISGNEWSWGGSFVRMVVVVLILAAINAGQAKSMLDPPDSLPEREGPALVKRP